MITGDIVSYNEKFIVIRLDESIKKELEHKQSKKVEIKLNDERKITIEQRKKIFSILKEIAKWNGDDLECCKEWLKYYFIHDNAFIEYFSLSECSVTLAKDFIGYLTAFCLRNGVPLQNNLLLYSDDVAAMMYQCLYYKKCVICGLPADFHHCDGSQRVGQEIANIGLYGMSLCKKHHDICHKIGEKTFFQKHHLLPVKIDKILCNKLNIRK